MAGIGAVPLSAEAAVLTITAVVPPGGHAGFLSVFPAGTSVPTTSSLNYSGAGSVPNLATVALGSSGDVSVYASAYPVDVVVDVEGYYEPSAATPTFMNPLSSPERLLDTRCVATSPPLYCSSEKLPSQNASTGAPGADGTISVTVAGVPGVPAAATAVSLVVTAAGPSSGGYLTVWPDGQAKPASSNVNFVRGRSSADSVMVEVGSGGKVGVYNSASAATNVVIDVNGYFGATGKAFTPSSPIRICDTRTVGEAGGVGDVASGASTRCANSGEIDTPASPVVVNVGGVGGVPGSASMGVFNVTVTDAPASGFLTVWPGGSAPLTTTSDLNWTQGEVVANQVTSALSSTGTMEIHASSKAQVIVDVAGWYG